MNGTPVASAGVATVILRKSGAAGGTGGGGKLTVGSEVPVPATAVVLGVGVVGSETRTCCGGTATGIVVVVVVGVVLVVAVRRRSDGNASRW